MLIANDFAATRTAGGKLSAAGRDLLAAAGQADVGAGAGGDAAARTDAALGSLAREYRRGLTAAGERAETLGAYADLVAAVFEKVS